jgi:hypothetical protein
MKRSLLLSLFAVAIVAMTVGQAMAVISLQLNLRYTDPADVTEGGGWDLLAKTDNADGIAGLTVVLDNINFGSATFNTAIDGIPIETRQSGTLVEFVWGYDPSAVAGTGKFLDVGTGAGSPGNVADDDLFPGANTTYDNMALIASGTFGGVRPSFGSFPGDGGGPTAGQNWASSAMAGAGALDTITLMGGDGVRGDSVATDGLKPGDANRNGTVDGTDFAILAGKWQQAGAWNDGDFNDSGTVDGADFALLAGSWQTSSPSPALAAVPEPASLALLMSALSLGIVARRSR